MTRRTKQWYESEATESEWLAWWTRDPKDRAPGEPAGREAYDHPDVTVDCAMLTYDPNGPANESLKMLVTKRTTHPFLGSMAITGTFLHTDENDAVDAVNRTMRYLFHTLPRYSIQQIRTFAGLHRDPRGQVVSILHTIYLKDAINWKINDLEGEWVPMLDLAVNGGLAFDHDLMVKVLVRRLQEQFDWIPNVFYTLPDEFTLDDAIRLRCGLFGSMESDVNRKNFRRKYAGFWNEVGVVDPADPRSRKIYSMREIR